MKRLGILISGRGSNFEAIADSIDAGRIDAEIAIVISNTPRAAGLDRARRRGLKAECIRSRAMEREDYDRLVVARLKEENVDLVCLAGFMRLLSAYFVEQFPKSILNIHPSLLPSFPGLDTHQRALAEGVKLHGCTVHFAREAVDHGPIIGRAEVPVLPQDDAESLAARVLGAERRPAVFAVPSRVPQDWRGERGRP